MATLAANASATQDRLRVSAIPDGDYFQIDDEIVRVIDKRTTQLTILVERAYAGTTAATHNSGATLTPLYVPSTGGGGGVRLIGPVRVDFDSVDVEGDGVLVAELGVGTLLLDAWGVVITQWQTPEFHDCMLDILVGDGESLYDQLPLLSDAGAVVGVYDVKVDMVGSGGIWDCFQSLTAGGANGRILPTLVTLATEIRAQVAIGGGGAGTATQGAADIYALIMEPT